MSQNKQSTPPVVPHSFYRPEIDGLRAIAVIAVIINHFNSKVLPSGFLGVDIFFVISGFVVTSSLIRNNEQTWKDYLLVFYSKRVKRLVPALVICVVTTSLIGFLFIPPEEISLLESGKTGIAALFGISNLYLLRQETNYFGSPAELNLFTQTWSLGVEEQFYLMFPILLSFCGICRRRRSKGRINALISVLFLSILSLVYYLFLSQDNVSSAFFLMPARFWELGVGCLAFLVNSYRPVHTPLSYLKKAVAPISIVLLIGVLFLNKDFQVFSTIATVFCVSAILWAFERKTVIVNVLFYKWIVKIGLLSYSLYLWHWSILVISRWTIGINKWTIPIQVFLILIIAIISYFWIEQPLRYASWAQMRIKTIAYGVAALIISAFFLFCLGNPFYGYLFTGEKSLKLIAQGSKSLSNSWSQHGEVVWEAKKCTFQNNTEVGKKILVEDCTFGDWQNAQTRYLVIGNSFSAAEIAMLKSLNDQDSNNSVTVTSCWGAPAVPTIPNQNAWSKVSDYYWDEIVPELLMQLRSGDILIMINDIAKYSPSTQTNQSRRKISTLVETLKQFAEDLASRGIGIIFQTGNPFMRETKCTPLSSAHWFNFQCHYLQKTDSLKRRAPVHNALLDVQEHHLNFYVLDIFNDLCPGSICKYTTDDGTFLFRDEDSHASVEGSMRAADSLNYVANALKNRMLGSVQK